MSADQLLADLNAAGLTVVEEPGWKTRGKTWNVDGRPEGVMQHHTAPPNPYPIKRLYSGGRIKCNMATHENGVLYLVAYGACNYSSGYGMADVLVNNVRAENPPTHNGTKIGLKSGNRHFWNYENSHPGDGSPLPAAQFDTIVASNIVVDAHFGLNWKRIISHAEWTKRKVDPRWNGDNRTAIEQIRTAVRTGETTGELEMLPLELGDENEDVRLAKGRLNMAYGAGLSDASDVYDDALKAAAAQHLGGFTGEPAGKSGDKINARMWNGLLRDFTLKYAVGGVTEAEVKQLIAETRLVP